MRSDGRPWLEGGEAPRRFSDAIADRPIVKEEIDEPPPRQAAPRPSPYATVGFSDLKRGCR